MELSENEIAAIRDLHTGSKMYVHGIELADIEDVCTDYEIDLGTFLKKCELLGIFADRTDYSHCIKT